MTHFGVSGQEQGMESKSSPALLAKEQRFREIYDEVYLDLLRFIRRRVHPSHAEDVLGDVMLVAWRRIDDLPTEVSDARAWLFGVARNTIRGSRRGHDRRTALEVRLAEAIQPDDGGGNHSELVAHRVDIASAWMQLSASHQEAIALSVLDGLTAPDAATVLGVSSAAYRLRLSRARRTLRRHTRSLDTDSPAPSTASERSL